MNRLILDNNFPSNGNSIKRQIKQIATKCQKQVEHFDFSVAEFCFYLSNYLIPYVYYDPIYWYSNPLIKLVKEHIGNEIPMCFFNYLQQVETKPHFLAALNLIEEKVEQLINNNEDISSEEAIYLLEYSHLSPAFQEKIIKFLIAKIMCGTLTIDTETYKKIFELFSNNYKKRNANCYIMIKPLHEINALGRKQESKDYGITSKKNGHYYIIFNEAQLSPANILENLYTLFHEIWHTLQLDNNYSSPYERELFLKDIFLGKTLMGYEKRNYNYLSHEADAYIHETLLLLDYLKDKNLQESTEIKSKLQKYYELLHRQVRFDEFGNPINLDIYFDMVTKNRGINPHTDLGLIHSYDKNGTRLRPLEIIKRIQSSQDNLTHYYYQLLQNSSYPEQDMSQILAELSTALETNPTDSLLQDTYHLYLHK